jgi:hypothetical protein
MLQVKAMAAGSMARGRMFDAERLFFMTGKG